MEFRLYNISKIGLFFPTYEITEGEQLIYVIKKKSIFSRHYGFTDNYGNEVMRIKNSFAFFKTELHLFIENQLAAKIISKGAFQSNYTVESDSGNYLIEGNLSMREFTIMQGRNEIAKISRKVLTSKNKYGLAVSESADQDLIIGMSFAMEVARLIRQSKSA